MRAEMHAARRLVSVEHRRIDTTRQGGAQEKGVALQRGQDHVAEFAGDGRVFGDLQVPFHLRALMPGGRAPVDPSIARSVESASDRRNLRGIQYVGYTDKHRGLPPSFQMNL
jgi:hypothetical protein